MRRVKYSAEEVMTRLKQLRVVLRRAWQRDTAFDPERWTRRNPAQGQCACSVLVAQDCIGGRIFGARTSVGKHFWNYAPVLGEHGEIDLTDSQFDGLSREVRFGPPQTVGRASLLRIDHVRRRYRLLRKRVKTIAPKLFE